VASRRSIRNIPWAIDDGVHKSMHMASRRYAVRRVPTCSMSMESNSGGMTGRCRMCSADNQTRGEHMGGRGSRA
jgi:hypothetical protein